jgi:hypothetical protein
LNENAIYTDTRRRALSLLRCADKEAGLVNGLAMFDKDEQTPRQGICLGNMNGVSGESQLMSMFAMAVHLSALDCFSGDDYQDAIKSGE